MPCSAGAELSNIAKLTVPPRDAKAFEVPAGHFFRIVSVECPQVGDLNLWNAHDLTDSVNFNLILLRQYLGVSLAGARDRALTRCARGAGSLFPLAGEPSPP